MSYEICEFVGLPAARPAEDRETGQTKNDAHHRQMQDGNIERLGHQNCQAGAARTFRFLVVDVRPIGAAF